MPVKIKTRRVQIALVFCVAVIKEKASPHHHIFTIHYYLLLPPKIDKELVKSEEVISKNRQASVETCRFLAQAVRFELTCLYSKLISRNRGDSHNPSLCVPDFQKIRRFFCFSSAHLSDFWKNDRKRGRVVTKIFFIVDGIDI